jgi:hypothetical protein
LLKGLAINSKVSEQESLESAIDQW